MRNMLKLFKKFKHDNHGAIGIGAMIVFIAMVLVAGIAASVLIQTSGRLETQAMQSGAETVSEVATGIQVESVLGYNQTCSTCLKAAIIKEAAGKKNPENCHFYHISPDGTHCGAGRLWLL